MRHPPRLLGRVTAVVITGVVGLVLAPAAPAAAAPLLTIDESRADGLVEMMNTDQGTFGGASLDEAAGTLTVRYAAKAGQARALTRLAPYAETAPSARRAQAKTSSWRIKLVPVDHSVEELNAVMRSVISNPQWRGIAGDAVSEWYVDVRTNRVAIGVTAVTPAIEAAASKLSGGLASVHVAARAAPASRVDDFEPWVSGIRIFVRNSGCTAGFTIRNIATPSVRRMVTAGHCGPLGSPVTNNGDSVGTVIVRNFNDSGLDVEYVGGRSYADPWTYKGPPDSDFGDVIRGSRASIVGRTFCTNGATSGEVCSGTVQQVNICQRFTDNITRCFIDRMTSTIVQTRPGDSGGGVFFVDSVGLKIGGMIVGAAGTSTSFHPVGRLIPSGWQFDFIA